MRIKFFVVFFLIVLGMSFTGSAQCTDPAQCLGGNASTPGLDIVDCTVKVDGRYVEPDRTIYKAIERGGKLDISVEFVSLQDAEDVQIEALILGYSHGNRASDLISDISPTFDVTANRSYEEDLQLTLPQDLPTGELKLRILISDRSHSLFVREYNLDIEAQNHNVEIRDILLDPSDEIVSGRGLISRVRVRNIGDSREDDVKVTVSIPALSVKAVDYINQIDPDDSETTGDVFISIPACAQSGLYTVRATVDYDDGYETTTKDTTIKVTQDKACASGQDGTNTNPPSEEKTVVTVPGSQDVTIGTSGAVYPIMISNTGTTSKTYTITVSGVESWGTYRLDPGNTVTVGSKKTEVVYMYVTANTNAQAGGKPFSVNIQSGTESKQVSLTANVKASSGTPTGNVVNTPTGTDWNKIKQGLEIGLVVLVVLLVILGLIIGFGKLRGKDSEEEEEVSGQTYY